MMHTADKVLTILSVQIFRRACTRRSSEYKTSARNEDTKHFSVPERNVMAVQITFILSPLSSLQHQEWLSCGSWHRFPIRNEIVTWVTARRVLLYRTSEISALLGMFTFRGKFSFPFGRRTNDPCPSVAWTNIDFSCIFRPVRRQMRSFSVQTTS